MDCPSLWALGLTQRLCFHLGTQGPPYPLATCYLGQALTNHILSEEN